MNKILSDEQELCRARDLMLPWKNSKSMDFDVNVDFGVKSLTINSCNYITKVSHKEVFTLDEIKSGAVGPKFNDFMKERAKEASAAGQYD